MPYDPSGNFSRVHNWGADRDAGIKIMADRHDEEDDNFANAFNQTLLRNGNVPMGGDLNMAGYRILGISQGNPAAPGISFDTDPNTGLYHPATGQLGVGINGVNAGLWNSAGLSIAGGLNTSGDALITGNSQISGTLYVGSSTGNTSINANSIEISSGITADNSSYIDFHSTAGSDFDARIQKNTGANSDFIITNNGSGAVRFVVNGTEHFNIAGDGGINVTGVLGVSSNLNVAGSISGVNQSLSGTIQAQKFITVGGGGGTNGLSFGNGDGASYSLYNVALDVWNGLGMRSFDGSVHGYYDARNGFWDCANGFKHSGNPVWSAVNDGSGSGLDADLLDGQDSPYYTNIVARLGWTPVQSGGGIGMGSNKVYIGWGTAGGLKCTIDTSDQGFIPFYNYGTGYTWGGGQTFPYVHCTGDVAVDGQLRQGGPIVFVNTGGGAVDGNIYGANNVFLNTNNGNGRYCQLDASGRWIPSGDAVQELGTVGHRWLSVYASNGSIVTSDAREKEWHGILDVKELAAASALCREIGIYQWLSAINTKGEDARLHVGILAQKVSDIMERNGLDATRYGFFCYDEWEEERHTDPLNEIETVTPAGNRFSVRYDELTLFMLAAQEQRLAALEAR
jgi:hypothetical protein